MRNNQINLINNSLENIINEQSIKIQTKASSRFLTSKDEKARSKKEDINELLDLVMIACLIIIPTIIILGGIILTKLLMLRCKKEQKKKNNCLR